ncbi:MAG: transpeptidase family protein [Bacteroidales bacterium]|nr:transpeptidase family protein [Bacteroidales bacterium]
MQNNIVRIGIVYILFFLIAAVAVGRIVQLQFFDEEVKDNKYHAKVTRVDETEATRGSILANDGRYLAFSTPEYYVAMDCTVPIDTLFDNNVEALAKALSSNFNERSTKEYVNLLKSCRKENKKYIRLLKQHVNYDTMKLISEYPILNHGRAFGGFITEKLDYREYPYGSLAFRTLGHLQNNQERPKVGVEAALDSVLRGTNGARPMRRIEQNEWIQDVEEEEVIPINGMDVQITLDVNIQDIAEKALLNRISGVEELEAGCVIVMEVATGEIRAMVNMEKNPNGQFTETYNYAIGRTGEPGSVFKVATLTTALEDGFVTLDTKQNAEVNWYYDKAKRYFTDDYLKNYTTITVRKGLEISSNNVFRRIAAEYYSNNAQSFVDKLNNDRKISYNYDFDLPGLGKATIRDPKDKLWSPADLPQIGMGYAVELTPLHIITYYNAIANNGIMVKPHIFKNFQRNGAIVKEFGVEKIGKICSKATADTVKAALRGVVTGPNGTARTAMKDCKVAVAGKTGTARVSLPSGGYVDASGRRKHQGSFVGFFPYDNPKYTVIVVIWSKISSKNFYGGTWGGPVACEIANNIYASSPKWNDQITARNEMPNIENYVDNDAANDTIVGIPQVIGMGLRDAIYALESRGYKVKSNGSGCVVEQNPLPGTLIDSESQIVYIVLNN